jgi:branched-chain amino acid transport system substrate-binding protein
MKHKRQKRVLVLVSVLLLCSLPFITYAAKAAKEPIKIGVLYGFTGFLADHFGHHWDGLQLAFEKEGWKVAGRQVELVKGDTQFDPAVGIQRAHELVEQHKVDFLVATTDVPTIMGIIDYVNSQRVPLIVALGTPALTMGAKSKYVWVAGICDGYQDVPPLADYMYIDRGLRRAVCISGDWPQGHVRVDAFKRAFEYLGGKAVKEIYTTVPCFDYAPYLAQIDAKKADCVFAFYAEDVMFTKQYRELGPKLPLFGPGINTDEVRAQMGEACVGVISQSIYDACLNNDANREYMKLYKDKLGRDGPYFISGISYVSGRVIVEAIKATKGDLTNREKLVDAIQNVKFDCIFGNRFRFTEFRSGIANDHIIDVVKESGKYKGVLLKTYKETYQCSKPIGCWTEKY